MAYLLANLSADVIIKGLANHKRRSFSNRDRKESDLIEFQNMGISRYNNKQFQKIYRHFGSHDKAATYYNKHNAWFRNKHYKLNMGTDKYQFHIVDIFDKKAIYYTFTAKYFEIVLSEDSKSEEECLIRIDNYNDIDMDLLFNLSLMHDVILFKPQDIITVKKILEQKPKGIYTICSTQKCVDPWD
ncbi:hypothetical protein XaC1_165 [Xanthomonas phage XaC1]|nr:hypothetical protein XaC1_165 [Xanthomonas phage XaC1]